MISFIFLNVHKNLYQGYKETLVVSLHHSTGNSNLDFRLDLVGVLHREDLIGKAWIRIYPFNEMGVIKHE